MRKLGFKRRSVFARSFSRLRLGFCLGLVGAVCGQAQTAPSAGAPAKTPPVLGTIKLIAGESLTVADRCRNRDQKWRSPGDEIVACPSRLEGFVAGRSHSILRISARIACWCGCAVPATHRLRSGTVIAMKKSDIAEKRSHEGEEWQKHGVGGLR